MYIYFQILMFTVAHSMLSAKNILNPAQVFRRASYSRFAIQTLPADNLCLLQMSLHIAVPGTSTLTRLVLRHACASTGVEY